MSLYIPLMSDRAIAAAYWKDHEWKKYAVDVSAGPHKRPTYAQTWYARSRTPEGAIACIKREAPGLPARARFVARLAGPQELGCVPTPITNGGGRA